MKREELFDEIKSMNTQIEHLAFYIQNDFTQMLEDGDITFDDLQASKYDAISNFDGVIDGLYEAKDAVVKLIEESIALNKDKFLKPSQVKVKKCKRKINICEALQYTNSAEVHEFCGSKVREPVGQDYLELDTTHNITALIYKGDYILKQDDGSFTTCSPDIFKQFYEEIE